MNINAVVQPYKHICKLFEHFWYLWSDKYLPKLHEFQKIRHKNGILHLNFDNVLVIKMII